MAFDGIVISCLAWELNERLIDGRINKIYQPETDALVLTIKNNRHNYRLLLSASPSLPLAYITEDSGTNPMVAPNFCMLLRKHISGGRIAAITQPDMERILKFEIEHLNELGDLCTKFLIVELMGKHSNIIFCQPDGTIIDSIKHISLNVSSVREVLPGRSYFVPNTMHKLNPLTVDSETFMHTVLSKPLSTAKALYTSLTGLSPLISEEICHRASIDSSMSTSGLSDAEKLHLFGTFRRLMEDIEDHRFTPEIAYRGKEPVEFSAIGLSCYSDCRIQKFETISDVLRTYYAEKNAATRIRQKSHDLRHVVGTALDRTRKKYDLQIKQLKDTEKREKYKIYGEMIHTYGYGLDEGAKSLSCINYYTDKEIVVPLDPQLTPQENSKKYFERYGKLKRTFEALTTLTEETHEELEHLDSVSTALDLAQTEGDLAQIKEELIQSGYIKRHTGGKNAKKQKLASPPLHYLSSDGYHMYVGKNNLQNEELTFKFASGGDWWFHAKGIPGSHVIVKSTGDELPDRTFEEASRLAAYYSKNRNSEKVEIDYIQRKHVKKPNAGKPGFVIYHTNYSMMIEPDIEGIEPVK
ncbi:Rqc2 family fibronectin-binding protein [Frisingicoccus sp.]|uniref:Rqc2 family fibronectin-binding protein n=1 Tax=Frisingicoccus sp. TaxID=1918627 RepID=UPI002E760184|nr:NFACT RNA binding domain-containing protein [Frisingicoccus sp.]MEE0752743.1 NFACT RNA binding domain-containing protein [Frisingicoccus sp.]